jgi:hypothetical protein
VLITAGQQPVPTAADDRFQHKVVGPPGAQLRESVVGDGALVVQFVGEAQHCSNSRNCASGSMLSVPGGIHLAKCCWVATS